MTCFVLVHGGWHGGWCYDKVAQILHEAGHEVFTPTLTGLAERAHLLTPETSLDTHIDDIVDLIEWEDLHDIVLCGHSYGGIVVTGVADVLAERIGALVYLDALLVEDGQSAMSILTDERRATLLHDAEARGGGLVIPPPDPVIWNVNPLDLDWIRGKLTPHPLASMQQPISLKGDYRKPRRTYVWAKGGTSERFYQRCLDDPAWLTVAVDGGHNLMVDDPSTVARILTGAVR